MILRQFILLRSISYYFNNNKKKYNLSLHKNKLILENSLLSVYNKHIQIIKSIMKKKKKKSNIQPILEYISTLTDGSVLRPP